MKHLSITVDGRKYDVLVEELDEEVTVEGSKDTAKNSNMNIEGEPIKVPMSGSVVSVNVSEGQTVQKGDIIVVLEAMKMENEILAPNNGKIVSLQVSKGQSVVSDQIIAILK